MLLHRLLSFLALALILPLAGCASRGEKVPYATADFGAPDTVRMDVSGTGVIGKLDTLTVTVYELPDMSREHQVDAEGNIAMPLVGSFRAEGLTTTQLSREIASRLAARYVRSPSVQVAIKQSTSPLVTVEGSVNKPGMYPVTGKITLLRAVALASGPDKYANTKRVVIFRQINGQRAAAAFNLAAIRAGQAPDPDVFGNDVVVLDGSGLNNAYRELLQAIPLLYIFTTL